MSEKIPDQLIAHGEVSPGWVDVGSNNAVYRLGEEAVKICLSLPNDYLETPYVDQLGTATEHEVRYSNDQAKELDHYFGDILLPSQAYCAIADVNGRTVQKMYEDLGWPSGFKLNSERVYTDVPLIVTRQPFFNPYEPPNSETVSFTIGKGDYNHLDSPPDRSVYERLNAILLGGEQCKERLDLAEVYDVQKSESVVYYAQMLRQDPLFKEMMRSLLTKIAQYMHETGGMIDIFPFTTNGLFMKNEKTGVWTPKFYEMSTSKWYGDSEFLNQSRRVMIANPGSPDLSVEAVQHMAMLMSYIRSLNVLAIESDMNPLFNIFCHNGDPNLSPDCDLSADGWGAVNDRIQEYLQTIGPIPPHMTVPASIWKGAPVNR